MDQQGRVALITGGNRGIGLEVGRQLAAAGLTVVLGARDAQTGERAAADLGAGSVVLDVDDDAGVRAAVAEVRDRHGRLDVLINNAAILYDTWAHAVDADLAEVRRALDTNLLGAWRTPPACLRGAPGAGSGSAHV